MTLLGTCLGEMIRLQRGHDLTEAERRPGTIPVIGSAGQNGWHDTAISKAPGVTIGRSGASAGVVTYCEQDYWPHNTCLYVTDFLGNHPRFISYYLKTLPLMSMNSGSAQQSLNRNFLYSLSASVPPVYEQRRIASILSAYDDLIEVNRRRVAILEEMARRLFEEWFVHLRFPGHEAVPVHDKPDGPLPEGWTAATLGSLLKLEYGRALKVEARSPGPFPVIGSSGVIGWHDKGIASGPCIVVGRKGNVGAVIWSQSACYPIDTTFYVRSSYPSRFVYQHLRRQRFLAGDTAVPGLNRDAAYRNATTIPPSDLTARFDRLVTPSPTYQTRSTGRLRHSPPPATSCSRASSPANSPSPTHLRRSACWRPPIDAQAAPCRLRLRTRR